MVKFSADHRSVGQYMDVDILLLNKFSAFGAGHHHTVMQVRRATNPTKRARGNRAFAQEKSGGNLGGSTFVYLVTIQRSSVTNQEEINIRPTCGQADSRAVEQADRKKS